VIDVPEAANIAIANHAEDGNGPPHHIAGGCGIGFNGTSNCGPVFFVLTTVPWIQAESRRRAYTYFGRLAR
jgi:hypothetical protein